MGKASRRYISAKHANKYEGLCKSYAAEGRKAPDTLLSSIAFDKRRWEDNAPGQAKSLLAKAIAKEEEEGSAKQSAVLRPNNTMICKTATNGVTTNKKRKSITASDTTKTRKKEKDPSNQQPLQNESQRAGSGRKKHKSYATGRKKHKPTKTYDDGGRKLKSNKYVGCWDQITTCQIYSQGGRIQAISSVCSQRGCC